jgi:hypothetical protein
MRVARYIDAFVLWALLPWILVVDAIDVLVKAAVHAATLVATEGGHVASLGTPLFTQESCMLSTYPAPW